ncbi:MAG: hypothetical protein U1F77_08220 [Kiritimatiellia bacterium]
MSLPATVMLDRWSLLRLLRVLVPIALLALAGALFSSLFHSAWGLPRAWSDASLAESGVASTLLESRQYRLGALGEIPAHSGALWHMLLWVGAGVWGRVEAVAAVLSLLCTVGTMIAASRLARDLFSGNIFVWGVMLALAVSPALLDSLAGQSSGALLLFLMMMAVKRHLDGMRGKAPVLSPLVALYAGLAGLVDPGVVLLYPLLALHAVLAAPRIERESIGRSVIATRAAMGVLILLLIVWPVVDLNIRTFRSPLPAPPLPGWDSAGWLAWLGAGRLQILPLLFGLLALVAARLKPLRDPFVSLLLILAPGLFLMEPVCRHMGWQGGDSFRTLLEPLLLLALGWMTLAVVRGLGGDPVSRGNAGAVAAFSLIVLSAAMTVLIARNTLRTATTQAASLGELLPASSVDPALVVATDLPGWMHHAGYRQIIDLTGRSCDDVLRCVDADQTLNHDELLQLFRARQPGLVLLRSPDYSWIQPRLVEEIGRKNVSTTVVPYGVDSLQLLHLTWSP